MWTTWGEGGVSLWTRVRLAVKFEIAGPFAPGCTSDDAVHCLWMNITGRLVPAPDVMGRVLRQTRPKRGVQSPGVRNCVNAGAMAPGAIARGKGGSVAGHRVPRSCLRSVTGG